MEQRVIVHRARPYSGRMFDRYHSVSVNGEMTEYLLSTDGRYWFVTYGDDYRPLGGGLTRDEQVARIADEHARDNR